MKYCSACGSDQMAFVTPDGDNRQRWVCQNCGMIHYQNPKVVAGCLIGHEKKILLCRRAIEPRYGLWTLPAGFMENGETVEQAAARETWEEAQATIDNMQFYAMFSIPHISQVYLLFHGQLAIPEIGREPFAAGIESLEIALFGELDIPWQQLAFPIVRRALSYYFDDQKTGQFPVRTVEITPQHDS